MLLLLLALLAGCGGALRPTHLRTDAALAMAKQRAARASVSSLQAEARVDQRGAEGRVKGTVLMFARAPAELRLDAMTQFGPAAILTVDGEHFAFSDLREKRYLHGPACPGNIARLLGIPLRIEEATQFLLGGTPVLEAKTSSIAWHADGFYRLELRAADGTRQQLDLEVNAADMAVPAQQQRLRLLRSELYRADGVSLWRVSYDDYEPHQVAGQLAVAMPHRVHIEQAQPKRDIMVRFKDIKLGAQIPDGAFTHAARAGMTKEEASCD